MPKTESISLRFDPDDYHKGERIFENGKILEISQIDKYLYNVSIEDNGRYEVELLRPLSKKEKTSCDCNKYLTEGKCEHIIAALIAYQENKQLKANNAAHERQLAKPKTASIKTLVSKISDQDLRNFVVNFSKKNKKFADALRVNFIRQIDLYDNEQKYKALLDSLIKPVVTTDPALSINELKQFKSVAEDLLEQAQDAIALKDFLEAWYIVKSVILKLHYVDHYYLKDIYEIKSLIQRYYVLASTLLDQNLAPEFRLDIKKFLFELMKLSYHHIKIDLFNAGEILSTVWPEDIKEIIEILEHKSSRAIKLGTEHESIVPTYALLLRLRSKSNYPNAFDLPKEKLHLSEKIITSIKNSGDDDLTLRAAQYFYKQYPLELTFVAILLELYYDKADRSSFVDCVVSAFKKNKDLRIIDIAKRFDDLQLMNQIRERLQDELPKNLSISKKAALLDKIDDANGLMKFLYETKDLRLLSQYDVQLYHHFPEEVCYLYVQLVEKFLDQHLGEYAHSYVNELQNQLKVKKLNKVKKKIDHLVIEKYSHRSRLNDRINS